MTVPDRNGYTVHMWAVRAGPRGQRFDAGELGQPTSVARGASLGFVAVGALLAQLPHGGLAPLVVALAVGLAIGVPAAAAEARVALAPAARRAQDSFAEVLGLGLVAVGLARVGSAGWLPLALALAAWPAATVLARVPYGPLAAGAGAVGIGALWTVTSGTSGPWTLLDPRWEAWWAWGPAALAAGIWLAGAGRGERSEGRSVPLASTGAAIVLATVLALAQASVYEASLGVSSGTAIAALAFSLVGAGAAAPWVRFPSALPSWGRPAIGAALTAILAGPAQGIVPWLLGTVLPALGALGLGWTALHAGRTERWALALAAAAWGLVVVANGRPVPASTADAVWLGLCVAGSFWFVASRWVLEGRSA